METCSLGVAITGPVPQLKSRVSSTPSRPHIVVILADDLGNADLGYRGSPIRTPHLDALAAGGVRLEAFYGQPVCTPARAALLTGRYPMRHGLQTLVIFPSHTYGLPTDERTLPEALREVGYRTAMVGKWHLGHADAKYWPQNRGFDHYYGNVMGEVDYFTHERGGVIDWQRNGTFLREEGYHTTCIGDEAVSLIESHDTAQPLFLYMAALAPHAPYQAPAEVEQAYEEVFDDPLQRSYAAMVTELDTQVGRVVAALEARGMRENTLILFSSDNGGATSGLFASGARSDEERTSSGGVGRGDQPPASNGSLRGGKGSLHEGGVRVPTIVSWPGQLAPAEVHVPLHMVNVMPTLLELAGAKGSPDHPFDGRSMWSSLAEGGDSPNEEILLQVEAIRGAIRRGPWKLVKLATLPGRTELFNVELDPGETTNLAGQHPEIVRDLEERLLGYARQMKPSEWVRAQPGFLGAQGRSAFDEDFDIDDGGLPHEKARLPLA